MCQGSTLYGDDREPGTGARGSLYVEVVSLDHFQIEVLFL